LSAYYIEVLEFGVGGLLNSPTTNLRTTNYTALSYSQLKAAFRTILTVSAYVNETLSYRLCFPLNEFVV